MNVSDFLDEVSTNILQFFYGNVIDYIYRERFRKVGAEIKTEINSSESNGIVALEILPYDRLDRIIVSGMDCDFKIPIPNSYKWDLKKNRFFTDRQEGSGSMRNGILFKKLKEFISVNYNGKLQDNINNYIKIHVENTAKKFRDSLMKGEAKSNNTILGANSITPNNGNIEINMFTTDYFTYNCIVSLYQSLYAIDKIPFKVSSVEDIGRISPFVCCLAVGGFLNINIDGTSGTLISKRSTTVLNPDRWHASFDETFDIRDTGIEQGACPSIEICLQRGLFEELHLIYDPPKYKIRNVILFLIQTEGRLESEIFLSMDYGLNTIKEIDALIYNVNCASDAENENSKMLLIPTEDIVPFYEKKIQESEVVSPIAYELAKAYAKLDSKLSFFNKLRLWKG